MKRARASGRRRVSRSASPASGAGCSHGRPRGPLLGAGAPAAETRDELLVATGEAVWRGDLATAHATLTRLADRERGKPDSALDFWSEMLALLRCEPLARVPRSNRHDRPLSDPWDGLRRLVQIERVRPGARRTHGRPRHRSAGALEGGPAPGDRWCLAGRARALERRAADAGRRQPVRRCRPRRARCRRRPDEPGARRASAEVALVSSAAGAAAAGAPGDGAAAGAGGGAGDRRAARPPPRAGRSARLEQLTARTGSTPPRTRARRARGRAGDDRRSGVEARRLLARGRAALALKINPPARRSLALLLADRLAAAGRGGRRGRDRWARRRTATTTIGRYIAFQSGRGARARRPARPSCSPRRARCCTAAAAPTSTHDPALDGDHGHGAAHAARVAGLGRDAGGAGVAGAAARAARTRRGVRAGGARGGRVPSAMATFVWLLRERHRLRTAGCSTWRARPSRRRAPAIAPSSRAPSACSPVRRSPPRARRQAAGKKNDKTPKRDRATGRRSGTDKAARTGRPTPARRRADRLGRGATARRDQAARRALGRTGSARCWSWRATRCRRWSRTTTRRTWRRWSTRSSATSTRRARPRRRGADHALPRRQRPPQVGGARLRRDGRRRRGARSCSATC